MISVFGRNPVGGAGESGGDADLIGVALTNRHSYDPLAVGELLRNFLSPSTKSAAAYAPRRIMKTVGNTASIAGKARDRTFQVIIAMSKQNALVTR